jgi:hypothetical protein
MLHTREDRTLEQLCRIVFYLQLRVEIIVLPVWHVRVDEVCYDSVLFYNSEKPECSIDCNVDNMCDPLNCNCAIVYEKDCDFGEVCVVEPPIDSMDHAVSELPSSKIDPSAISHLSARQREQLLRVLDQFPECFSHNPGLCTLVEHEIPLPAEFRPKRLKAYRVPENLKVRGPFSDRYSFEQRVH